MSDIHIRKEGRAGRITLDRPKALNALTYQMCLDIEAALDDWRDDPAIDLLVIDATGEKAFCAGGDIQEMYDTGKAGNFAYGKKFWRDEYRMNAKLAEFPKPVVTFLQGFTMGGGVGVGCHGSHRIVCETSQIAMPEVGIGLVPDVGGSLILARAPGRIGEYLGLTAARMDAGDAIFAGFADYFIPEADWPDLKSKLIETGNWEAVDRAALPAPDSQMAQAQADIDACFGGETLGDIARAFPTPRPDVIDKAEKMLGRNSPLAMACALPLIRKVRAAGNIRAALDYEYRFTSRSMERGDFIEGIRAAIIDRDRNPAWKHTDWRDVPGGDILAMSYPVTDQPLTFDGEDR